MGGSEHTDIRGLFARHAALAETGKGGVLAAFGGDQFFTFKTSLVDLAVAKLSLITAEMKRIVADAAYIDAVLADGSARAQKIAAATMGPVKDIVGSIRR